jgi:putative ABC transport system permease protein
VLKTFFATAARQLLTQKLFTAINVAGLALGIACATLIALFVRHELSYDRHYAASDRIVRFSDDVATTPSLHFAGTAAIAAPLLKAYFPEVERIARLANCFSREGGGLVTIGEKSFYEPNLAAADNEIFDIFDFEWLQGDPKTALAAPTASVVTASAARRYFGTENPLGRTFALAELGGPFEIRGVIRDLPDNTHLRFDLLISLQSAPHEALETWNSPPCFQTYALLAEGADVGAIQSRSGQFFEDRFREGSSRFRGFSVVPITGIHLHSTREGEMRTPGSITTVYTFSAIAVFVLLIACINFINLATARAAQRAKEVGVRKTVGGTRGQLITQFLSESLLITAAAVAFAIVLVIVTLPVFARFVDRDIGLRDLGGAEILSFLLVLTLLVGLVAGSYPAFFLSAFRPVRVLRGDVARGSAAAAVRKALVVLQFSISIALAVATLIVFEQEKFARGFDLGYVKDQVVVLSGSPNKGIGTQREPMKQQWLELPEVRAVTASDVTPGTRSPIRLQVKPLGADGSGFTASLMGVDFDFFETYEIKLVAGRTFAEGRGDRPEARQPGVPPSSPQSWVLSELAVRRLGWTLDEAIGRPIDVSGEPGVVVGVVADVHLESVRDAVTPVAYGLFQQNLPPLQASIRVTGRNLERTLTDIDAIWRRFVPESPVMRRFLDQDFEALYRGEQREGQLLTLFSLLAILIACLGLFGLASFATVRRTKEIGIRKALGGSVADIVFLFTSEFGLLALLANVLAWPVAYVFMRRWLEGFAYRIELDVFAFVASGALALIVAVVTVAAVASRAARAKPVDALRYE